jgi:hypothetical protein
MKKGNFLKWRWQIMFDNGRYAVWGDFDLGETESKEREKDEYDIYHSVEKFMVEKRCLKLHESFVGAGLAGPSLFMVQLDSNNDILQCYTFEPEKVNRLHTMWNDHPEFLKHLEMES